MDLSALEKEIFQMNEEMYTSESQIDVCPEKKPTKKRENKKVDDTDSDNLFAEVKKRPTHTEIQPHTDNSAEYQPGHLFEKHRQPLKRAAPPNSLPNEHPDKITEQEKQSLIDKLTDLKWLFPSHPSIVDENLGLNPPPTEPNTANHSPTPELTAEQRREAMYQKSIAARARKEAKLLEIQRQQQIIEEQERQRVRQDRQNRRIRIPTKCEVAGLDDHIERMRPKHTNKPKLKSKPFRYTHQTQHNYKVDTILADVDDLLL